MQKDRKTALFRRGDALVTGFSNHLSRRPSPEYESDNNSYGELGRFRGASQPGFRGAFY